MRITSLLLLLTLCLFAGVPSLAATVFSDVKHGCCGGGEDDQGEPGANSAPCNPAECACIYCVPAELVGATDLTRTENPLLDSFFCVTAFHPTAFPNRIDYPPETSPA